MSRRLARLIIVLVTFGFTAPTWAQQAGAAVDPTKIIDSLTVTALLKTNDTSQVQQAMQYALQMLGDEKDAKKAADEAPKWLKSLLSQKRLDKVEELALAAIVAQPTSLSLIEKCQEFRIRATLVSGKPKEALALAKGLYNVCSMPSTSHAIDLISECIYDLNKDGNPVEAVKKYKLQQIRGAWPPTAAQKTAEPETSMVAEIQVDDKAYRDAIVACDLNADGFTGLLAKGNLLLLAGQSKEAKKVLEKAYSLAPDKSLAVATDAFARAMRAEDGTVGRANAWILSLRPEEAGQ